MYNLHIQEHMVEMNNRIYLFKAVCWRHHLENSGCSTYKSSDWFREKPGQIKSE